MQNAIWCDHSYSSIELCWMNHILRNQTQIAAVTCREVSIMDTECAVTDTVSKMWLSSFMMLIVFLCISRHGVLHSECVCVKCHPKTYKDLIWQVLYDMKWCSYNMGRFLVDLLVKIMWESKWKKGHGDLSRGWEQLPDASALFTDLVKGHNDLEWDHMNTETEVQDIQYVIKNTLTWYI